MLNFEMKLSSEIMVDGHPSTISPKCGYICSFDSW